MRRDHGSEDKLSHALSEELNFREDIFADILSLSDRFSWDPREGSI